MFTNHFFATGKVSVTDSSLDTVRKEQDFYEACAYPSVSARMFSLVIALMVLPFCFAVSADDSVNNAKAGQIMNAAAKTVQYDAAGAGPAYRNSNVSPITTFIDGPTGFVFVYTVEGWKFVGNLKQ